MYKHILIPTDGSEPSQQAVKHGLSLAKALDAKVTAMTATLSYDASTLWEAAISKTPESYERRVKERAAKIISQVSAAAEIAGMEVDTAVVRTDHPWQAIVDMAAARNCDLIVMASHGWKGVAAVFLGSETQKVLAHSKVPVLVHRMESSWL